MQNFRGKTHRTEFFLYNVENFMLVGDVSLNREKNKAVSHFEQESDVEFMLDERPIKGTSITNKQSLNADSQINVVMRMHFVMHTFLNLLVTDQEANEIIGYRI